MTRATYALILVLVLGMSGGCESDSWGGVPCEMTRAVPQGRQGMSSHKGDCRVEFFDCSDGKTYAIECYEKEETEEGLRLSCSGWRDRDGQDVAYSVGYGGLDDCDSQKTLEAAQFIGFLPK